MLMKANRNYPGPRTANFDAIVWRVLEDAGRLIGEVERGETDLVIWAEGLEPGGQVDQEWGPASDAADAGDQRYFVTQTQAVDVVALNPNDPLLADVTVREAIAQAMDRAALAAIFDGEALTSLLSPSVPGSDRTESGSPEPNVERALELMAGRTGSVTVAAASFPAVRRGQAELARQLEPIGISVRSTGPADGRGERPGPGGDRDAFGDCGC